MQFCRYRVLRVDRIGFLVYWKLCMMHFPGIYAGNMPFSAANPLFKVVLSPSITNGTSWCTGDRSLALLISSLVMSWSSSVKCGMMVGAWLYCVPLILDRCQNYGLVLLLLNYNGGTQHAIQYGMMISWRVLIQVYSWYLIFVILYAKQTSEKSIIQKWASGFIRHSVRPYLRRCDVGFSRWVGRRWKWC